MDTDITAPKLSFFARLGQKTDRIILILVIFLTAVSIVMV